MAQPRPGTLVLIDGELYRTKSGGVLVGGQAVFRLPEGRIIVVDTMLFRGSHWEIVRSSPADKEGTIDSEDITELLLA